LDVIDDAAAIVKLFCLSGWVIVREVALLVQNSAR
jgi:hypothetical protein